MQKTGKSRKTRIALDTMGGDFAPINEIEGALEALKNKPDSLEVVFVGKETKIRSVLSNYDTNGLDYSIVNADQIVKMDDDPSQALKKKKNSSLYKGIENHRQGYCNAFISAGNTGAILAMSTILLGRIKNVSRPTIGTFIPTQNKYPTFLLDVGATVDTKSRFLYEYAVMGSILSTQMLGLENPRVGLVNIGEEPTKGTEVIKETYQLLKNSSLNFIGNVEGRDILLGSADVVVCDGFTGNIILKFAESVFSFIKSKVKSYANKNLYNKISIAMAAPHLRNIFREVDYQEYGGVPLLGINGNVMVGHGKSSPKAIENMIYRALEQVDKNLNEKIEIALNPPVLSENNGEKRN